MAAVILHAEGDARTGLGHLVRMAGAAGELAAEYSVHLASASPCLDAVVAELAPWARGPFSVEALAPSDDHPWSRGQALSDELSRLAEELGARLLVSDGKAVFPDGAFSAPRESCRIVVVDNVVASPAAYDVLVLPTCHADPAIVDRIGGSRVRTGAPWTFVHPAVRALVGRRRTERRGVFVSMGGADPNGLTERAVRHLVDAQPESVVAAVGPANRHRATLLALAAEEPRLNLVSGSPDTHDALASSRWALCAFGITTYEAVALNVPLVVVPHDGVIDGDIERFLSSFAGVRAVARPEMATAPPCDSPTPAPELGGLAASLASAFLGNAPAGRGP